jgi:hypothetical protein
MQYRRNELMVGIFIVLFGTISLLANLRIIDNSNALAGFVLFLAGAFFFYKTHKNQPNRWWASLCFTFCLCMSFAMLVKFIWNYPDDLFGAVLLWISAILFLTIFIKNNRQWWAIIPAGICFTLGMIVVINVFNFLNDSMTGAIFFLGVSCTFFSVWIQSDSLNRLGWARYPAIGCLLIAVFIFLSAVPALGSGLFLPFMLVLAGAYVIVRSLRKI